MTSFAQNGLLLDVQHVTMRFGGITAVNDLSMRIPTGSITGLIGPNGAGKTTAFNVISGFYNPQEGDIPVSYTHLDVYKRQPSHCPHWLFLAITRACSTSLLRLSSRPLGPPASLGPL